ncbi:deoxynucleoside triphosphate triphosphohydrolase SAMHD1-like [Danio aesculapii]|uniref:deoxynucleoside triphosphate triphosphohydrolase SAMHD1-like n=1 Tax=Danio aesculapii TaxID=1142201 RepID=UPI0024BF68F3|nr:deoxynucleoside triphosphate triphosphohydrolase SAMHD1-like [Danio aesculapii]
MARCGVGPGSETQITHTPLTVNDPIHGHIALHPLMVKIMDTPQFQRLRHLKQLGGTYLVYPGASHNRFEHCVGVAHLAGCLVKSLHDNQPELKITKQDFLCVQIAGLCHDLGHGPLSHAFDGLFMSKVKELKTSQNLPVDEHWTHEEMSVQMFDSIVNDLKTKDEKVLAEHGLDDKDVTFIKELINRKITPTERRDKDKSFLYEIVANEENGIDVDKWDYFARDCHHLGIPNNFDHLRLLKSARVCDVEEKDGTKKHICFREKEANNIYEMFRTRYTLHRQAYQHKIGNIIEDMFADALLKADRDLPGGKPDMFTISKAIERPGDFIKLTDGIFEQISSSTSENLSESKKILEQIAKRELPKFVGEARLEENKLMMSSEQRCNKAIEDVLTTKWKEAVRNYKPTNPEDFLVYVVDLSHGIKGKQPFENIYFYSKWDNKNAFAIKDYQRSSFVPETFREKLVRVYYKKTMDRNVMEDVVKCFYQWCDLGFPSNV